MGTLMQALRRALSCVLGLAALGASAAEPLEYAVKAAYIVKFPFYVEWPPSAFSGPNAPLALCVVGEDPFGRLLDEAAAGQEVQGHPLVVRRMKSLGGDSNCHVVYLGADVRADARVAAARSSSALVVTDAPNNGGMINFVVRDNRVRFTVDDEAAAQSGLSISSKLLNVALAVKSRKTR